MGSYFGDPSQWRLRTPGGLPYKLKEFNGGFDQEDGEAQVVVLILASDLYDFMTELMPEPTIVGGVSYYNNMTLPGFPSMSVDKVTFKSLDSSMPIDPFGFDAAAASGTYYPVLEITILYNAKNKNRQASELDPSSFLEISSSTSGEFITTTAPKGKWDKQINGNLVDLVNGNDEELEPAFIDNHNGEILPITRVLRSTSPPAVANPTVPITIVLPTTEWTVRWNRIDHGLYKDTILPRLRYLMGRVNKRKFSLLFDAAPETLLFMGWSHTENHTWRANKTLIPPISIEMKFMEKRILWNGMVCGHNHMWKPGEGWQIMLMDGENPTYRRSDYDILLKV